MLSLLLSTWLLLSSSTRQAFGGGDTLPTPDRSHSLKLVAEGDQRFFYFRDLRQIDNNRSYANIWGGRVGLLYRDKFKTGIGYYFGRQRLNSIDLFPEPYIPFERRFNYATIFFEPFIFRRRYWEFSAPIEVGWGVSRYRASPPDPSIAAFRRGSFVPAGAGLSFSIKLPALNRFRAMSWFGINVMGGYRFILDKDFPPSQVDYRGFYYSVNPVFFLDRFTTDYKTWRRRRKSVD